MELGYVKIFFIFTWSARKADPYLFFGSRARFQSAFRNVIGCSRGECSGCLRSESCPYPANFGQKLSSDPEAVKRHQKPPLPFVFAFPVLPPSPCTLECSLTIFGNAIQQLNAYLAAVRLLLQESGCALVDVLAASPGGERTSIEVGDPLTLPGSVPLLTALDPTGAAPLSPDAVTLRFVTPVKLVQDGKVLRDLTFPPIARALMRRVSSIAYYYGGAELPVDFRTLSTLSERVQVDRSDCRFVKWGERISGVVGALTLAGDLEPFHLLLLTGCAMHLGKAASFGLGDFRILP